MTTLHDRLRNCAIARLIKNRRRFQGNIEGFRDGEIYGWVARASGKGDQHLSVGAFTAQGLLAQVTANIYRGDLQAAGIGHGDHGFFIQLTDSMLRSAARDGGRVFLRVIGDEPYELGSIPLPKAVLDAVGTDPVEGKGQAPPASDDPAKRGRAATTQTSPLKELLFGDIEVLDELIRAAVKNPHTDRPNAFVPHAKMFAQTDYLHGGELPGVMSAYAEYVRYRYNLDTSFPIHDDPAEVAHFLNWFIAGYGPLRKGLRVPMSAAMIAALNEPVLIPGQRQSFSRVTWSFLMGVPPILNSMNFQNPDWVIWAVYWWSIDQAKSLHCEDVLVPDDYIELLAAMPPTWQNRSWPLSQFMIRKHAQTPGLTQINLSDEAGRQELLLALVVMAAQRPDYLRYLPAEWVGKLLKPDDDGHTPLSRFVARHAPTSDTPVLDRAIFANVMQLCGFDLETRRFLTVTENGDRFEAAKLPTVETGNTVDIQMIGPFEKASGLGQATRLSASVLRTAGYDVNSVNFGLDNPAPEGFSTSGRLSDWKQAKVNLIHLNAESIPLVYAYAPDVFSDAYNIGYFYWELNTPAACHFLGMDLLDEIWVSTEYGVQIYEPENNGKPVVNVGMCYEDLPDIDRTQSRRLVCDRFGFDGSEFVFLVTFDSFSFIQRKNPIGTLKAFLKAFDGVRDVRLVIKTQNRTKISDPVQQRVWEETEALLQGETRVKILDETLPYEDLLRLKKGCDCYVSLHKSEGWGFGMIEAMNLGVPVVATAYSGNMDFCSEDTVWLVDFKEVELSLDDYIFVRKGQKWAEPDIHNAARQLHAVYTNHAARAAKANAARDFVHTNFSTAAIGKRYNARLDEILGVDGKKSVTS